MSKLFDKRGFFTFGDEENVAKEHMTDYGLARALIALFAGDSVIDFGCGTGEYVRMFQASGIGATGFDGNPFTEQITQGLCKVLDLSQPFNLGRQTDWVMSLEVGEHIPAKYEKVFLDNITTHCKAGVVLSWSTPEIEKGLGLGHVNCRTNEYIQDQMIQRGFVRDLQVEARLRKASTCYHFPFTLMVYLVA